MPELPSTEKRLSASASLGGMNAEEVVALMDDEEARTLRAVREAAPPIAAAAERVASCFAVDGTVVLLGSGTSGRIAAQEVAELPPTFGVREGQFVALIAAGASAGPAAITRSEDDEDAAPRALSERGIGPGDAVLGVAASGTTPFVVAGLRAARGAGAWTCGIANNPGTPVLELADLAILLATGPEVLTGSTRLQAATAQKLALNRITTAAMVRSGRVIENHMVDVVVSIEKLERRAVRIVEDLAGVDGETARQLLASHGWRVRDAIAASGARPGSTGDASGGGSVMPLDLGARPGPSANDPPAVLALAPHPDDEALGACGTLLQLGSAGWRVVVLACSHGRPGQAERRRRELAEACSRARFEVREPREPIGISATDDQARAEESLTEEIAEAIRELAPRLVLGPSPHDGHHGHEVVGRATHRALAACPTASRPRWWLWELWSSLPTPTLFVRVPADVMDRAAIVLAAHIGELERNDYARALTARAGLAAVLGRERVFGWGANGTGEEYAEVLMEILCDQRDHWPLAAPRVLDPRAALESARPRGADVGAWLASPSPRTQIVGGDAEVIGERGAGSGST